MCSSVVSSFQYKNKIEFTTAYHIVSYTSKMDHPECAPRELECDDILSIFADQTDMVRDYARGLGLYFLYLLDVTTKLVCSWMLA